MEYRFWKNEFFFLRIFLKDFGTKFSFKPANKICIKLFSVLFRFVALETYFGCAFSIPNDIRALFWIYTWIFDIFSKESQNRYLQHISLLAENIPLFLPISSNVVKPILESCRVDPGDAFTYLSWSHIMSRSNFRIREIFFSNFIFYAYFSKGNFKAPVERLFSAKLDKFFHRILKNFLIAKTISTWVLEVFLDDAEKVFIMVYELLSDI